MSKKRNYGGGAGGFLSTVATILAILALLMVIPLLGSFSGSPSSRPLEPSTPLDDGLVHFKLYTTIHGSGCPDSIDDCYDDYVEFTCPEGSTWADVFGYEDFDKEIYCSESSVYVQCIDGTYGHGYQYAIPNVSPGDLIVPGVTYGQ